MAKLHYLPLETKKGAARLFIPNFEPKMFCEI